MKVCFPVLNDRGVESKVYGHFGSAPVFIVVETDTDSVTVVDNKDLHHTHGACNPTKALNNHKVDAVVVGGIGAGALSKLNELGIKVFSSQAQTVKENVAMFMAKTLPELTPQQCCPGHGVNSVCNH